MFETASIKASRPDCDYDYDALLARVKSLESVISNGVVVKNTTQQVKVEEKPLEKKDLLSVSVEEVMGIILKELRKNNREMLRTIISSAKIKLSTNEIVIIAKDEGDLELLSKEDNRKCIENALASFMPFTLKIIFNNTAKSEDAFYEETENIKKIFGDDIVIIK